MGQKTIFISTVSIKNLLTDPPSKVFLLRAAALEKQATHCDVFFPWPALAESFRNDAEKLRQAYRKGLK